MKKRLLATVLAATMAIGFTACSGGNEASNDSAEAKSESSTSRETSEEKEFVVGMTDMASNEMAVAYEELLRGYLADLGADLVYYTSNSSVDDQIKQLEDLVTKGVDVIFVKPVDNNGIEGGLATVKQAGIPVVFEEYDENLEDYVTCFDLAMNHYGYGVGQAEDLIEKLEADPDMTRNVAILWGMKGLLPAQQRRNGFVETIQPYIDEGRVEIVAEDSMEGDITKLQGIIEGWFSSHPEIDTYVCPNDEMAMAVIACLDAAGKSYDNILIYGMDASEAALPLIKEGKITASISRDLDAEAKAVAELLVKVAKGEEVEKQVDLGIPAIVVNQDNVEEFAASENVDI